MDDSARFGVPPNWGPASRVARFVGSNSGGAVVVHVGKWLATATGEGVTLYITSTEASMALSVSWHRAEFFVGFEPEEDEVASSWALLAKEALSVEIDHGHTIEVDGGLWSKTAMNAWLVMRPLDAIVPATRGYDHHVEYLQALPLYPSERTWKSVQGAGAFMQRWQDQCVPFWDPRRPSSV